MSHYSEKARWALDYKRIPHPRRWLLTEGRGQTVPVLVIDGEGIGDSTEIIGGSRSACRSYVCAARRTAT